MRPLHLPPLSLVTGIDAAGEVGSFVKPLAEKANINLTVVAVANEFFGGGVTVTGLLAGKDIREQLAGRQLGDVLLLPDVVLRDGEDVLLDDVAVSDLEADLGVRVEVFPADPYGLWDMLDTLELEFNRNNHTGKQGE